MLTKQLLERLEDAWRKQGAPFEESLAPGRDLACFDSDDGSLHVDLPTEVRTWWAWHDGGVRGIDVRKTYMGPLVQPMSSAQSWDRWQRSIAMAREAADRGPEGPLADPDYWWREAWVPLFSDGSGYLVADCELDPPDLAPIRRIEWGPELDVLSRPRTTSLGQYVEWWIEATELGFWTFDRSAGMWERMAHDLGIEARYLGLI